MEKNYNFLAKVVAGHRITIPKKVCQLLQIEKGELLEIKLTKLERQIEVKGGRVVEK